MKRLMAAATAALALAFAGSADAAVNLLENGDFEALGGSSDGWTTTNANVYDDAGLAVFGAYGSSASYTNHAIALHHGAVGDSRLQQIVETTVGEWYTLTFDYAVLGNTSLTANIFVGSSNLFKAHGVADNNLATTFSSQSFRFRAKESASRIFFYNSGPYDGATPLFDNVSLEISAIPEPSVWAMMIVGFGLTGGMVRLTRAGYGTPLRRLRAPKYG